MTVREFCPLFIINWNGKSLKKIMCLKDNCAWWTGGTCAVFRIAQELIRLATIQEATAEE